MRIADEHRREMMADSLDGLAQRGWRASWNRERIPRKHRARAVPLPTGRSGRGVLWLYKAAPLPPKVAKGVEAIVRGARTESPMLGVFADLAADYLGKTHDPTSDGAMTIRRVAYLIRNGKDPRT